LNLYLAGKVYAPELLDVVTRVIRLYDSTGADARIDFMDWAFVGKLGGEERGTIVISTANSAFTGKIDRIKIPPGDSPVTIDVFEHLRLGANRKLVFDGDWQGTMIDLGEDAPYAKWIGLLPADPGPAWYLAIVDDKGISFRQSSARDWGTQKVLIDFVNSLVKLDAGYKLWFGDDVNLYRKDADWLKTDDRLECLYLFIPTPGLGWDNAIKIYDSGSRIQRVDADTFAFTMPNTDNGQIAFDVDGVGIRHRFGYVYAEVHDITANVTFDSRDLAGGVFDEGTPLKERGPFDTDHEILFRVMNNHDAGQWASGLWVITIE